MIWFVNRIKRFHFLCAGLILIFSIPANASDEINSRNILSSSKINTIIVDNYYPYTFMNKNGDPDGFSVDLIKAVTKVMGIELGIRSDTREQAKNSLIDGSIDLLPMMAYSKERDTLFDFSVPHTIAYDALFIRKKSIKISTMDDLKGKAVIVMKDDQAHDYLRSSGLIEPENLIFIKSIPEALRLLASGKGDAALMPKLVGLIVIKDLGLTNLEHSPAVIEAYTRPFSFAVKQGNQPLLERLNQGLSIVKNSNQYNSIYEKWFGVLGSKELSFKAVAKYILMVFLALVLIGLALTLWSIPMRKQVAKRTRDLEDKILVRKQAEEALKDSEKLLNEVGRIAKIGGWEMDLTTGKAKWTKGTYDIVEIEYGQPAPGPDEHVEYYLPEYRPLVSDSMQALVEDDRALDFEAQLRTAKGSIKWCRAIGRAIKREGSCIKVYGTFQDITDCKKTEESLKEANDIINKSSSVAFTWKNQKGWPVEFVTENVENLFGYTAKEFMTGKANYTDCVHPEDLHRVAKEVAECGSKEETAEVIHKPYRIIAKDGSEKIISDWTYAVRDNEGHITHYKGIVEDITERKQTEKENEKLQAQFRQAQKMEAIGTLASGVAHDFNNLLTTIIGNAELGLMDMGKDHPLREEIEEIKIAGERAASLTRQLLAFSRKQVIKPEVMDFNEVITATGKMLKRLIGEDIELSTVLEPEPWKVYADQGQMEQVIMNLAVNARDAMPQGGRLTVETANIELDKDYFRKRGVVEGQPGPYVILAVSDTGAGMDKETQARIFEPFFTTKGIGKGTGLGLSTIYGIVKQNNGFIWVYSEPGRGSTFKVYLPKVKGDVKGEEKKQTPVITLDGSETVLIVEDDDSLRKFAQKSIQPHGYRLLVAENGEDALRISKEHEGPIDLLITDVVMPRMGGKETAERLQTLHPQMKVIYMSGYTDGTIVDHGVLAPGLNFLEKPFSPEGLARKVREVLDPAFSKK